MTNDQLDFAFVAELPTAASAPKKRASRGKARTMPPSETGSILSATAALQSPTPQVSFSQNDSTADSVTATRMAALLEAHPDYRVLRRLQPRLTWPDRGDQAVCRVAVLDTETTGLDHSKDRIIELALVRVDVDVQTGLPVGGMQVYDGLEDPGLTIPREVQEITGISNEMVQGKRLDEAVVARLLDGVDLVIAHNAGFDRPFCEARMPVFRQLAWACSFADVDWREQGRRSAKLESLAFENGWFYDAHRAEMDCHALLAVLAEKLPKGSSTGLARLIEQAAKPSYRLMATNAPFDAKDQLKARGYRWNAEQKVWHTRIGDSKSLDMEFAWLKENAYHQRSVVVQFERLDAGVRYSSRSGEVLFHQL